MFGIGWTIIAFSITRDSPFPVVGTIFPLFGVLIICVVNLAMSMRNTVAPNRNSILDRVDSSEEPDPLNETLGRSGDASGPSEKSVETRLNELEELRSRGTISQEEYHATHLHILGEI